MLRVYHGYDYRSHFREQYLADTLRENHFNQVLSKKKSYHLIIQS